MFCVGIYRLTDTQTFLGDLILFNLVLFLYKAVDHNINHVQIPFLAFPFTTYIHEITR